MRPAVGVVKVGAAAIDTELGAGGARGPVAEVGEVLLGAGEAQGVVQHLAGQGARQGVLTLQDLHVHHVGCLQRQANDRLLLLLLLFVVAVVCLLLLLLFTPQLNTKNEGKWTGKVELGHGKGSWQWAKHAWLYSDLLHAVKEEHLAAWRSQQKDLNFCSIPQWVVSQDLPKTLLGQQKTLQNCMENWQARIFKEGIQCLTCLAASKNQQQTYHAY